RGVVSNRIVIDLSRDGHYRAPHSVPTRRASDLRSGRSASCSGATAPAVSRPSRSTRFAGRGCPKTRTCSASDNPARRTLSTSRRSEEHTAELQSRETLVCRLLLEKTKTEWKTIY